LQRSALQSECPFVFKCPFVLLVFLLFSFETPEIYSNNKLIINFRLAKI